jgi:hypothetical protein
MVVQKSANSYLVANFTGRAGWHKQKEAQARHPLAIRGTKKEQNPAEVYLKPIRVLL